MVNRMIQAKASKLKALREDNQSLSYQAAQLSGMTPTQVIKLAQMRIEIREMKEELQCGDNQYMLALEAIYHALGYSDSDPAQADILYAINLVHRAAIGNGYRWNGDGYEGDKAVGLEYVRGRVIEQMGAEAVV